jgi:hypothetical protein
MKAIWKFSLEAKDSEGPFVDVKMPRGAHPYFVGLQGAGLFVWAMVDTEAPLETVRFAVVGTGREWPEGFHGIGAVIDGPYVWHVAVEWAKPSAMRLL